jgi:signal transduction histidine kinase
MKVFGQVDGSFTRNYDGVGLGLPLSRNLAELHGGSLELRSRAGVGTTAIVKLPQWRCLADGKE